MTIAKKPRIIVTLRAAQSMVSIVHLGTSLFDRFRSALPFGRSIRAVTRLAMNAKPITALAIVTQIRNQVLTVPPKYDAHAHASMLDPPTIPNATLSMDLNIHSSLSVRTLNYPIADCTSRAKRGITHRSALHKRAS